MAEYDIAIIGGGPGGYVAAIRAAQLGKSVVLIEKERVGGLCLNWGCIPSKSLLWNAEVVNLVRDAETYGIAFDNLRFDMGKAIDRSRQIVDQMVKGVEFLLKKNGVRDDHRRGGVRVADAAARARAGRDRSTRRTSSSRPARGRARCPASRPTATTIINSRDALALREQPESVVIVGGGPIGVEFATVLARVRRRRHDRRSCSTTCCRSRTKRSACSSSARSRSRGIKFVTGAQVAGATARNGRATVTFTASGKEQELEADKVLDRHRLRGERRRRSALDRHRRRGRARLPQDRRPAA